MSKSDVPAPVEDQLPLDHIFEDTKEEESTKARLPKHVSFSDDFPRDGTSEDKAASPVRSMRLFKCIVRKLIFV